MSSEVNLFKNNTQLDTYRSKFLNEQRFEMCLDFPMQLCRGENAIEKKEKFNF